MVDMIQDWIIAGIFAAAFGFLCYVCVCLVVDDDWGDEPMNALPGESVSNPLTLGSLDVARVRRIVIVRTKGAVRTMKVQDDIAKFLKAHAGDRLERYDDDGRLRSVAPGVDYRSLIVNLK